MCNTIVAHHLKLLCRLRRWVRLPLGRRDGAGMVEFALTAPVLILFLAGIMEISMVMLVNMLLEGGVRDASRFGITVRTIGGDSREQTISNIVNEHLHGLATVGPDDIDVKWYPSFGEIAEEEYYVDANENGQWDTGEFYDDANGNGEWDPDPGTAGAGDRGAIVVYRVNAEWQMMTPLVRNLLPDDGIFNLRASVAVQNEP